MTQQREHPLTASSAAFLVVAALVLPDSEVHLDGVLLSPTRTAFLEVLWAMGERDAARRIWRQVRADEPDNETLSATLARLQVRL